MNHLTTCTLIAIITFFVSCSRNKKEAGDEEIRINNDSVTDVVVNDTSGFNSVSGNLLLAQLPTYPSQVILTGLPAQRLVTIYKKQKKKDNYFESFGRSYYYDGESEYAHFMPGIDLLYGHNLINIAHYDLKSEKQSFLFDHPVLVKSLYYPSYVQDSVNKKPINRNYFLVSVYDQDTNRDTLINKIDLRRLYLFNGMATERTQLIPPGYSVERSQYDSANDIMYIFARQDANNDGKTTDKEPLHIFWFSLADPAPAKRMY